MMKKLQRFVTSIKYKLSTKYYFIASVREEIKTYPKGTKNGFSGEDISGKEYTNHESRCWGFYKSKKEAIRAVKENWSDMNEAGYYHWVVIEPHYEGLLSQDFSTKSLWFEEDFEDVDIKEIYKKIPESLRDEACVNTKTGRISWVEQTESGDRYMTSNFKGYKQCEIPEFAKNVCGWTIS